MTKDLIKTADIGNDWFANLWSDGSATLRNCEKGQRIDLPAESVERFKEIYAQAEMAALAA